jgi:hypothetical protein
MPKIIEFEHFQSDFSQLVFMQIGAKAAKRAMRIWDRMGLPEPSRNQFSYTARSVAVPLNEYGISCVFRSRSRNPLMHSLYEGSLARHDAVLQPLHRRFLDDGSCMEIRPGIKRVRAQEEEITFLRKSLKEAGLKIHLQDDAMVGVLPTGKRDLVIANSGAIKRSKKTEQAETPLPLQSEIFGELQTYVSDAFKSASKERIRDALGVCRDIVCKPDNDPAKILYGVWETRRTSSDDLVGPRPIVSA